MELSGYEKSFSGKTVMITGALGSIGGVILDQISTFDIKRIILTDNRETELFYASKSWEHDPRVEFYLADIRDIARLRHLSKDVDIIFHAAALKHVFICEHNPIEAVQTNIMGTQNLIDVSIENHVEKLILISTDKAVNPNNIMGATKLAAERLLAATSNIPNHSTKFGVVRFGNVLASRGSVIEIWKEYLARDEKIPVTDPNMTRFFMSMEDSVNLVLMASTYAENGEIFILKMPSIKIADFAKAYLELSNRNENFIEFIGKKSGEKDHEDLVSASESADLLENDFLYLRLPLLLEGDKKVNEVNKFKNLGFNKSTITSFSSADEENLLGSNEIKNILAKYV